MQTQIFPRITPSVGLPVLYLNHSIKCSVTSPQVFLFCAQILPLLVVPYFMQHPTLQNVRIRSTRDALQVFHGVATHRLPLITRRLDAEERRNIVPGNVYVWSVLHYNHRLNTGDVDSLVRQGGTWSEHRAYRARYGTMVC